MYKIYGFFFIIFFSFSVCAQSILQPGFNGNEFKELFMISFQHTAEVKNYKMIYQSKQIGLYNRWDFWVSNSQKVAVIRIRGTANKKESWLENFYAAMIPAQGSLQINDSTRFDYKVAESKQASVHVGWLLGLSFLAPEIVKKIKEYYAKGYKDFIIVGHSQGGAISFLLRSYLQYRDDLPKDIVYKSFCSAAPKPGNLYYAYDFDFITRGGWGYRIVNSADWVPETPLSTQTVKDFNEVNVFTDINSVMKNTNKIVKWYIGGKYRKMARRSEKSNKFTRKNLGKNIFKLIHKSLPQLKEPEYSLSVNYMTAGTPIILQPDENYYKLFPYDGKNKFVHHMYEPYLYLLEKDYIKK